MMGTRAASDQRECLFFGVFVSLWPLQSSLSSTFDSRWRYQTAADCADRVGSRCDVRRDAPSPRDARLSVSKVRLALAYLNDVAVGIADIASDFTILVNWLGDELGSPTLP